MKINLFLLFAIAPFFVMGQLRIMPNGSIYSKGNTLVYSNKNLVNDGILSFETGTLVVDKNFINNTTNLNLTRATLKVGSGNPDRSNVNQTLRFFDLPLEYPVPSSISGSDKVLNLVVEKDAGDVLVDRGMLHITRDNVADDLATLAVRTATTLDANDRITLRSTSTSNTSLVAPSHINAVVNRVVVEKHISAKRGTRFLNSTVNTSLLGGTINSNWQESVFNTAFLPSNDSSWVVAPTWENEEAPYNPSAVNKNPRPGYGTHITGANGTGTDAQPSGNPSLFTFNNESRQWFSVLNTTGTNLNVLTPYRMVIRGDRSVNINFNASAPTTTILRSKGTLPFGDINQSVNNPAVDGKLVFFTNAYQSIVDISELNNSNTSIAAVGYQGFDIRGGNNGSWVSVFEDTVNPGTWINTLSGSDMNQFLQPGQSFFVTATSSNPSITFSEDKRLVSNNLTSIFSANTSKRIRYNLYYQQDMPDFSKAVAGGVIEFSANYSNNIDYYDSVGSANIDETILSVSNDGFNCLLQRRDLPFDSEVLNLNISRYRQQNYALRLNIEEFLGKDAFLKDNFLNTESPLEVGANFIYNFSVDNSVPASIASNRFDIVFRNNLSNITNSVANFTLYPNPNNIDVFYISTNGLVGQNVNVKIINMLGQLIGNTKINVPTDGILELKSAHLAEGVYNIVMESEANQVFNSKLIKNN